MKALQREQWAEAEAKFEGAIAAYDRFDLAQNGLGITKAHLGDMEGARKAFARAIASDANFVDAYGNRGTLLAEMGRPAQALADFDRALTLRPNNAEDVSNRAGVLADLGRTDEALMAYSRAIGLNPNFPPNYFNRAAFAQPQPGTYGSLKRNSLTGPNYWSVDLAVSRAVGVPGMQTLELRLEAFNLFNRVVFGTGNTSLDSTAFGLVTNQANTQRQMQVALKLYW